MYFIYLERYLKVIRNFYKVYAFLPKTCYLFKTHWLLAAALPDKNGSLWAHFIGNNGTLVLYNKRQGFIFNMKNKTSRKREFNMPWLQDSRDILNPKYSRIGFEPVWGPIPHYKGEPRLDWWGISCSYFEKG